MTRARASFSRRPCAAPCSSALQKPRHRGGECAAQVTQLSHEAAGDGAGTQTPAGCLTSMSVQPGPSAPGASSVIALSSRQTPTFPNTYMCKEPYAPRPTNPAVTPGGGL